MIPAFELCHEKMYLKIFVVVIPKEGSIGPTIKLHSTAFKDYIL